MKHYIFDIGGVLINFSIEKLVNKLVAETNSQKENIEILFSFASLYPIETGKISSEEYFKTHLKPVLGKLTYDDWISSWMDNYSINASGVNLLLALKKSGNKIYILSNLAEYNKIAIDRKFPELLTYSDYNFFSYELGNHKPEPEIYQTVLNFINDDPGNIYFFDDTKQNIDASITTGINGFVFSDENCEKIKQTLNINY